MMPSRALREAEATAALAWARPSDLRGWAEAFLAACADAHVNHGPEFLPTQP
jgi:hypothetical protein